MEDDDGLWMLPIAARLRWSCKKDGGFNNCDEHADQALKPLPEAGGMSSECHGQLGDERAVLHSPHQSRPKASSIAVQSLALSKLKPCLRVARKVGSGSGSECRYEASDELLILAGDRSKKASQMKVADWAALELRICDTTAARNAHLSLLAAEGKTDQVYKAFANMLQARLHPNGATYSALVTALVAGNRVGLAQDLSRDTPALRLESFNKIMNGFALRGDDSSVRQIMLEMRERKLALDVVSYNTLLKALRHKSISQWPALLAEMESCSVRPNHITFCSLMSQAARLGDARSVEELIQQSQSHGVSTGTFAFNILIQAYIQSSDWQSAHGMLKQMRQESLGPDVVTYTTLMKGQPEAALCLLEDMRKNVVQPNSVCFTTLISSLTRSQQVDAAIDISKDMHEEAKSRGTSISSHMACAILHACAKAEHRAEPIDSSLAVLASQVFHLVKQPDAACQRAFSAVVNRSGNGSKSETELGFR